ncbi:MAG: RagB/SusD family nutrient uptake outer membrane protein [Chitinophaga sp.]|jgi:starch-binding outer membrane protein, SusD/RagB family|nr:RagB/SusD family nutrient uptake outer membrane protein [Chitinophaga sp.]
MKKLSNYIILACLISLCSCKKIIDLYPESNPTTDTYYTTSDEVQTALIGCYSLLQKPMYYEWQLTELRSDNTKMGVPTSSSTTNRDLSDLDEFIPSPGHSAVYNYWLNTYNVIRNANTILKNLGVAYDPSAGTFTLNTITIKMSDSLRKQYAGEAMVLRANAYFNLVRLYGGVFLLYQPVTAEAAKQINRSSVADIYKLIVADLTAATTYCSALKFSQIPTATIGRVNAWVAKGLLAKVQLTLNNKTAAAALLQDIISNSGYSLQSTYANVFSISNEMNSEILFTVRYKAGNLGLGSSFGNDFAPLNSGTAVINGSGLGLNYPTNDIDTTMGGYTSGGTVIPLDPRKATCMSVYGVSKQLYVKKYLSPVVSINDGESDWPVLRYADILLMLAEAQGYSPSSIALINQVRTRAGLTALPATVNNTAAFEQALANERRLEFAFENQRWFDLVRYNTTMTTITAEQTIKNHFAKEFANHYSQYSPVVPLATLQSYVTHDKLLLPIPQHEIDTNSQLTIPQNPGY